MKHQPVRHNPVARFWYKGSHTHPIRRTILVVSQNDKILVGYELREGRTVRPLNKAPIKSYRRDKIAIAGQLRPGNVLRVEDRTACTLQRSDLVSLLEMGI